MAVPRLWTFRTVNTPPSLTISQPSATDRWTGGTIHTIAWSATDGEDPPSALTVWVNYSLTGAAPWTAIIGPVPGTTTSQPWTTPVADTTTARVEITVVDTGGDKTVVQSPAFAIDSTSPTISGTNPVNGAINVPTNTDLQVTFSERMNTGITGNAAVVALRETATSAWIPLSYSWDGTETVLTASPPLLSPTTTYRLFVNASAQDASSPGLTMGIGFSLDFTTSSSPDTTPPAVSNVQATPAIGAPGGNVNISATVTDDRGIGLVAANVTLPGGSHQNLTMAPGTGSLYFVNRTWAAVGVYPFIVWAVDTSGNADSASGTFSIVLGPDTTPPTVANVQATPSIEAPGGSVNISATVTDDRGIGRVDANITLPDGSHLNLTMGQGTGSAYYLNRTWTPTGAYPFVVWAVDTSGNADSGAGSFSIVATPDTTPPEIVHTAPGAVLVGQTVTIRATVTDDGTISAVWLNYTDVGGTSHNVTMSPQAGEYRFTIPASTATGAVRYRIWAEDDAGNVNMTPEYSFTVQANPTSADSTATIVALVLVVLLVLTVTVYALRRRKKGGEQPPAAP
jgi:hypothetical protein